jgi:hypothetical protein
VGLGDEPAVDVEAFGAGEESGGRLVLADLRMEVRAVGSGDVGWVADDCVEGRAGGQSGKEVGLEETDAVGYVVVFRVELGDVEGFCGEVKGGDVGLGEVDGQGDGDGSGAGAYVGDGNGVVVGETGEDGFDKMLGLRARDEDGGCDVEGEAKELLLANDVLDGLVSKAAVDASFVEVELVGGEFVVRVGEEGRAGDLQGVEKEEFGVAGSFGAEVLIGGQLLGCGGEGLAEVHDIQETSTAD